jgi:hypothetical protein
MSSKGGKNRAGGIANALPIAAGRQFGLRFFNATPGRVAGQDDADVFAAVCKPAD